VDGVAYFDGSIGGSITVSDHINLGQVNRNINLHDGGNINLGSSADVSLEWSTNQSANAFMINVTGSMNAILTTNYSSDHDHEAQTNPTLFVHSATDPDTANDEWISMTHNQTNGVIDVGSGAVVLPHNYVSLGSGATTFAVEGNVMVITGHGGGNTIGTITGGEFGMHLILIFTDANVTITDTAYASLAANQIALPGWGTDLTSAAGTVLHLVHDGTGWVQVSVSENA